MPDGGAAGTSSKSGQGGRGGQAGSAGTPAAMPVPCGSSTCNPPPNPLAGLLGGLGGMTLPIALPMAMACCADESKGTCGTAAMAGAACEIPATPDARCPGLSLGALGGAAAGAANLAAGCCTPGGQCGLDGAIFGRGCVDNSEAGAMLGPLGGFLTVPAARACDQPLDDAGTADAGS